jgi:hypothetical protein
MAQEMVSRRRSSSSSSVVVGRRRSSSPSSSLSVVVGRRRSSSVGRSVRRSFGRSVGRRPSSSSSSSSSSSVVRRYRSSAVGRPPSSRATLREHRPVDLDDEEGWAAMWGFDYEGCEPGHFRLVNRWLPHLYLNRVLDWWRVKGFPVRADWLSAQWQTRPTADGSGLVFLNVWKPEALVAERGRVSTGPAPPEADPPTEFVWRLVQVA